MADAPPYVQKFDTSASKSSRGLPVLIAESDSKQQC